MINKFLTGTFLVLIPFLANAQTGTIKGVVLDAITYDRLPFASVYINYTTIGTAANEQGEFTLRNIPLGQQELIITFVGHHNFQSKITIKDTAAQVLTFHLHSNELLKEVKVYSKREKSWERHYEKFKKMFLGNSIYAAGCEILNPWILDFKMDNKGFFYAMANDVLQIENYRLGYTLFYQLKSFKVGSTEYIIQGNIRFKPIESTDSATIKAWEQNRLDVYMGSSRQLFAGIISRTIKEDGFVLYQDNTSSPNIIRMANFLTNIGHELSNYAIENLSYRETGPNQYQVKFPARLEVHYLHKAHDPTVYRNITHQISWVEVSGDRTLSLNAEGIVSNASQMHLMGAMSEARVAELLPYDFVPDEIPRAHLEARPETKKEINTLSYLLEKPYLHIDKTCYYPNEMLWLKGYVSYFAPVFRDSLSRVLYVEVIDSEKEIVLTKLFPIERGKIIGNFIIPPSLQSGNYVLRAYTQWMLNFDSSLIYSRPIRILDYSEVAKSITTYATVDSLDGLSIKLQKDTFHTREKIKIELSVKDFLGNFTPANFSVSVTDFNQVPAAANEGNIRDQFPIPNLSLPDSLPPDKAFDIQYGIDLKGKFVTKKGKADTGIITVAQENTAQVFMVTTEEDGFFEFHNLRIYDSVKLSALAKDLKGRIGKIILDTTHFSPPIQSVEPLLIEVFRTQNPSRRNAWDQFSDARVLEEVTIQGTPIKEQEKSFMLTAPDYSVSGNWLRENNTTDIVMALQSRIPGLRVVRGSLLMGPPSTFHVANPADAEPLVLIDGIAVNGFSDFGGRLAEHISALSPQEIEKIEVVKHSAASAYGARGANGVIAITTRKTLGGSPAFGERSKFEEIKISGFSPVEKFVAPDYSNPGSSHQRGDYRSTIYWNPSVSTNTDNVANISFYAADLPTQYRIVVEGITSDGKVTHGEKLITVLGD